MVISTFFAATALTKSILAEVRSLSFAGEETASTAGSNLLIRG